MSDTGEEIRQLRIKATEALKDRGIAHPDPMQVVAEMKAIKAQPKRQVDTSDVERLFGSIFR